MIKSYRVMIKSYGVTLIELLICIGILAILFTSAWPGFSQLINRKKADRDVDHLIQEIAFARMEAVSKNKVVTICPSNTMVECSDHWSSSLITFIDHNKNGNVDKDDTLIRQTSDMSKGVAIKWKSFRSKSYLQFLPTGITNYQNGSFTVCPASKEEKFAHQLVLNVAGRTYLKKDTDGDGIVNKSKDENLSCL